MNKNIRDQYSFALIFSIGMFLLAIHGSAEVRMPHIFGSNMVLQQGMPVPVWGWAEPGEAVSVQFDDVNKKTTANANGEWKVKLPSRKVGEPCSLVAAGKDNTLQFDNVLVGEVWFCSGQSNMAIGVGMCNNPEQEIANANYPDIRLYSVEQDVSGIPNNDAGGAWYICTPQAIKEGGNLSCGGFSAAAYYFGRELHNALGVPVGLIESAWGGTCIEQWIPPVGFAEQPGLEDFTKAISQANQQYAEDMKPFFHDFQAWKNEPAGTKGEFYMPRFRLPIHPLEPASYGGFPAQPTVLFNSMVNPILPFAIRGALWYQGESNRDDPLYGEKMRALINGWRTVWGEGEFPFYYVQIAPFSGYEDTYEHFGADAIPMLWEDQMSALNLPNTGIAGTYDITDLNDIHPKNKQDVGKRLALQALAKTYGQKDVVYSGPLYKSMKMKDGKAVLHFDHAGAGLMSRDDKPLSWFTIAGEDKQFVPAEAQIVKDTVVVSSDKVAQPAAVRFGWSKIAEPNLSNKDGLPALPFRTDKW